MTNLLSRFSTPRTTAAAGLPDPFEDLFKGFFVRPVEFPNQPAAPTMRMDVKESDGAYQVHAELPGVKKEDIQVTIDGNTLSISAEVKQEKEEKEGEQVLRSERYFGKVSRSVQLAHEIDEGAATARFSDGVLELALPKRQGSSSKRLTIA
ncbi:HSP20 family protein [Oryzomicrobium terrae]|uniref:HSP20 family protein n=1 Tax=Oryzomicrobium terrae TaxID=1735038 RepID=A0A5C1E547_9RHOO|nr:Hsp20/alpha crystallin family protein [Oryzomicrobium terrae]QEL64010.1 HSP20 family protein [Oryzomicrobium terrae]